MPMLISHMHSPSLLWLSTADKQHYVSHSCSIPFLLAAMAP